MLMAGNGTTVPGGPPNACLRLQQSTGGSTLAVHSKRTSMPKKPRRDFPLFPHQRGYWAKKVRGKLHYFGKVADDSSGQAALRLWLEQRDDLLAGRTPRSTSDDGVTLATLCNHFLTAKEQQRDNGDITGRSFDEYFATCTRVVKALGRSKLVANLTTEDFLALRDRIVKQFGFYKQRKEITFTKSIFKYAFDAGLIDTQVRFGPVFKGPSKRVLRAHRQKGGSRMFEAPQIRALLDAADQPLKAMILLGVNCGFGNTDCGTLPQSAINFKTGWIDFPRTKTAIERRCPLWPETLDALREAILLRPAATLREHDDLVFITKYGGPWAKDTSDNPVTKEFRKLIDSVDAEAAEAAYEQGNKPPAKIHRYGLGFYALRHTFETIAGESRDQVAVNHIMGHVDPSMAGIYRERISNERLQEVVDVVHRWLFLPRQPK